MKQCRYYCRWSVSSPHREVLSAVRHMPTVPQTAADHSVAVVSDGGRYITAGQDGCVCVWKSNLSLTRTIQVRGGRWAVAQCAECPVQWRLIDRASNYYCRYCLIASLVQVRVFSVTLHPLYMDMVTDSRLIYSVLLSTSYRPTPPTCPPVGARAPEDHLGH